MAPRPHPDLSAPPATPATAATALELVACPLCGQPELSEQGPAFPPYRVVQCRCGLWYLSPRLAEKEMIASYQAAGYFEGGGAGYSSYQAQEPTLRRTFRRLVETLERRGMAGGRLLEVGCAYGFFLDEARGHFDLRVGTEFSATAAERSRPLADRVLLGGLDELAPDERFDLAAAIHVIEHVYSPVDFLRQLGDHLVPGGWVVLATPDMGGFWRPLLGRRWPFYKTPEHVTYFDRHSLAKLLETAGYTDIQPLPYPSYFSLDLVAEKLGVRLPPVLGGRQIRLPATTVAMAGRK